MNAAPSDQATPGVGPPRRGPLRTWLRRVWVVFGLGATTALVLSFQARGLDPGTLLSDAQVVVLETRTHISFRPTESAGEARLLFLPGGMVQPSAYAPVARAIAEAGFEVVIVKLPFLGRHVLHAGHEAEVARRVRTWTTEPGSRPWVLAGHSMGGRLAAEITAAEPGPVAKLVLVATTHPRDVDLSRASVDVVKIHGTRDGVASLARARENAPLLPADTRWYEVEGGNHAQFANYGPQLGDGRATISRAEQQRALVSILLQEMQALEPPEAPDQG